MSKNNFEDELERLRNQKGPNVPIKIDRIISKLIQDGDEKQAEAIISAAKDVDLPMFTLYKALTNSGHEISYTAVRTARRKYSGTGV